MLAKRIFSPILSQNIEEVESPYKKKAKTNSSDGPGKSYFESINNQIPDDIESDEESQIPSKEEDLIDIFNTAKNNLMNFLQISQKMKERNFLSPKELKNKFKVNFTVFPNTDEILKIYNKILKRMSLSKTQKRNWYEEDILLLLWVIRKYSCYINKHPDNLDEVDWNSISEMVPVKSSEQCKYKFLTLKKVDLYKYPWTKDEDKYLKQIMNEKGSAKIKWGELAKKLSKLTGSAIFRSGKLCRERWNNYLNPDLKKCEWNNEEDVALMDLVLNLGKKWSEISKQLPGRNENAVKNRFFSLLRKERKKKNYTNLKLENASFTFDQENFTNSEEINLINIIISEKSVKKKEKESSIQEIKLINLTNTLENIKLNPVIIDSSSEILLQKAENFENFKLKTEVIEEAKSNSLPSNPNINISPAANNYSNNQTNITYNNNHSRALPNNMSSNGFLPHQQNLNFCGNPHISDHNINNPYYNNIIFQNIPKLIQMNNFGYLNPFSFPQIPSQQMPPQIPIPLYDNLKYNQFSQPYSPQDFEKYDNVIYNHPLFQNQPNIIYNQTPQTLKNNENEKRDSTFSNHPLVENTNEKPTNETNIVINNSTESFPNFNLDFQYNQSRQINSIPNTAQFNNSNANNETPEEYLWKFKIKNGLELNKADYGNCLYSVVNLSKRELYVFSPLSNPSESNRSIFSNLFKNAPSSFGSNNIEDYISFNSGNRSLTKNEIVINNNNQSESFRKIKKNKTYNSLVSSHPSSGNISKEININNTQLSYSPTHSPRKDSKFKGAKDNFGFFE